MPRALLEKVTVEYNGGPRALCDVTLEVREGTTLLVGPNGSGKTTILRLLAGLIPHFYPASVKGRVLVEGVDPTRNPDKLIGLVGYAGADPEVQVVGPTGWDEASLAPSMLGLPRQEVVERALEALRSTGALHLREKPTAIMSSGELQRTGLAGVLSLRPRFLLLDEPLELIDPWAAEELIRVLERMARNGFSMVIATHRPQAFSSLEPRVVTVRDGRVEEDAEGRSVIEEGFSKTPRCLGELVLRMRNVGFRYPRAEVWVLRGFSLELRRSEIKALVGPNGSGKTTILKLAAGILKPREGVVVRRERPAYLPCNPLLVFDKPTLRGELEGLEGALELASTLGLEELLDRGLATLSTGELRRAALATVLSRGRKLLLLDEPTAGLDLDGRRILTRILDELACMGYSILLATHDREWAERIADEIVRVGNSV